MEINWTGLVLKKAVAKTEELSGLQPTSCRLDVERLNRRVCTCLIAGGRNVS